MKCQEKIAAEVQTVDLGVCGEPVAVWRQCGNGAAVKCKLEIGYCTAHGGDARAEQEMRMHHVGHDAPTPANVVCELCPARVPRETLTPGERLNEFWRCPTCVDRGVAAFRKEKP